jgi:dihydroxyacetone kinase
MPPKKGRSSYLGERVLGHRDPGAEAVAVWLAALADVKAGGGGA